MNNQDFGNGEGFGAGAMFGWGGAWRGWGPGARMGRGDMGPIVLHVLKEKPMHGYEIIRHLEEKSHGLWRPSAGSIYPTLQLLEEQDLVKSRDDNGKKIYELTAAGRAKVEDQPFAHTSEHFQDHLRRGKRFIIFKDTMRGLIGSMRQIGLNGSDDDIKRAKTILDTAVNQLSKLAEGIGAEK